MQSFLTPYCLQGVEMSVPMATAMLFHAVCLVMDDHASTGLLEAFGDLLCDVPTVKPRLISGTLAGMCSHNRDTRIVLSPEGHWTAMFSTKKAWELVLGELLPALSAACEAILAGSRQQQQQQDGIFRVVAVSAWTCCNPRCTNMAGQQEASLALSKCAGCEEACYCSK